eukprot:scaffold305208_cov18-Prasinocladus_malaysianus.AAC.1
MSALGAAEEALASIMAVSCLCCCWQTTVFVLANTHQECTSTRFWYDFNVSCRVVLVLVLRLVPANQLLYRSIQYHARNSNSYLARTSSINVKVRYSYP